MEHSDSIRKVLVVGGAGYLGTVLCHRLLTGGYKVRVLDALLHGGEPLLGLFQGSNFEFERGDVRNQQDVERAMDGVDAVVHLAAIVGDPACARQPELAKVVNLDGSLRVFETARKKGVARLIFASTCSNYGRMPDPAKCVDEQSPLAPVSLYAETKVAVEKALLESKGTGLAAVVLRFATVFGLSPRMRFDLTVNEFTMELLTRRKLVVFGEQFWRPYTHVRDAALAISLVLDAPAEQVRGQVFNVGDTEENYQKKGIIEVVRAQVSHPVEIQLVHKQEDPRDYRVSFEKIRRELGFRITARVPDGVREIIHAINDNVIKDLDNPRFRN